MTFADSAFALTGEDWYWIFFVIAFFIVLTVPAFIGVVLPIAFATAAGAAGGRTPGKALLGLSVRVAMTAEPPRFRTLLWRECVRGCFILVFGVVGLLDHLAAVGHPHRQTWHDRAAGTIVVARRERSLRDFAMSVIVFSAVFAAELAAAVAFVLVRF
jgi:uncharacterized RDD family membrane protein YckC